MVGEHVVTENLILADGRKSNHLRKLSMFSKAKPASIL